MEEAWRTFWRRALISVEGASLSADAVRGRVEDAVVSPPAAAGGGVGEDDWVAA